MLNVELLVHHVTVGFKRLTRIVFYNTDKRAAEIRIRKMTERRANKNVVSCTQQVSLIRIILMAVCYVKNGTYLS